MNMMHGPMQGTTNRPVYWRKNQVTLTLFPENVSVNDLTQIEVEANSNVTDFNNQVLKGMPPEELELLHWHAYSAHDRSTDNGPAANIAVCCNIRQKPGDSPATPGDMGSSATSGGAGSDGGDRTLQVINYLNAHANTRNVKTRFHAMPSWFWSCVPDQTHVHGTFEPGSRDDDWGNSGNNPALAAGWADFSMTSRMPWVLPARSSRSCSET